MIRRVQQERHHRLNVELPPMSINVEVYKRWKHRKKKKSIMKEEKKAMTKK